MVQNFFPNQRRQGPCAEQEETKSRVRWKGTRKKKVRVKGERKSVQGQMGLSEKLEKNKGGR